MNQSRSCIFCGALTGLSKEHFWPEWLAPHLPPAVPNSHISELHSAEGKQRRSLERRSERPGGVHTKKIRAVCSTCNNGWMSALESKAKPVILSLINRSGVVVTESAAKDLALWITVKAIVGEHATSKAALTTEADRALVFKLQQVPSYFRIFVAYHDLDAKVAYFRHSTTVSRSPRGPTPPLPVGISRNIQTVTFLVGSLCIYVTAARVSDFDQSELDPTVPMHRLWPRPVAGTIDSGEVKSLTREQVAVLGGALDRLIAHPRVVYAGNVS